MRILTDKMSHNSCYITCMIFLRINLLSSVENDNLHPFSAVKVPKCYVIMHRV